MTNEWFTGNNYELTLISLFKRKGYQLECGYSVELELREPWHMDPPPM